MGDRGKKGDMGEERKRKRREKEKRRRKNYEILSKKASKKFPGP